MWYVFIIIYIIIYLHCKCAVSVPTNLTPHPLHSLPVHSLSIFYSPLSPTPPLPNILTSISCVALSFFFSLSSLFAFSYLGFERRGGEGISCLLVLFNLKYLYTLPMNAKARRRRRRRKRRGKGPLYIYIYICISGVGGVFQNVKGRRERKRCGDA